MNNGNSPLEMLAAFSIVFVAGAASAMGLAAFKRHLEKKVAPNLTAHR